MASEPLRSPLPEQDLCRSWQRCPPWKKSPEDPSPAAELPGPIPTTSGIPHSLLRGGRSANPLCASSASTDTEQISPFCFQPPPPFSLKHTRRLSTYLIALSPKMSLLGLYLIQILNHLLFHKPLIMPFLDTPPTSPPPPASRARGACSGGEVPLGSRDKPVL